MAIAIKPMFGLGLIVCTMCPVAQADDCIRSTPTPMFPAHRDAIQAHRFALESDHEALERFQLGPAMQVKVEHGGCEYFVTKLRFESPKLFAKNYTDAMAYETAASLLKKLKDARPELPFDLDLASARIAKEARRKRVPGLNQEFVVDGDGVPPLQATVVIDAAGRGRTSGYVEVTLFRGPL
jgi:hypothetical protein